MALEIPTVAALSMLPVSELRGAIPYGILAAKLGVFTVYATAVFFNLLVIPIVFAFLDYAHAHLMKAGLYRNLFGRFVERTKKRADHHVTKYGYLGLTMFVAIPLPVTGAYTGTLAAWLFGMQRKKAMLALAAGVIIAGAIVTAVTMTGVGAGIFLSHLIN